MKILIGINTYPGHAHCRAAYVDAIRAMKEHAERHGITVDVLVVWNGNQPVWGFGKWKVVEHKPKSTDRGIDILRDKQNLIRSYALKRSYDAVFMSESDTLPVEDTLSAWVRYDKDIISSPYMVEAQNNAVVKIPLDNPKYYQFRKYSADKAVFQQNSLIPCVWGLFKDVSRMWKMSDLLPQRGLVRCVATGIGAALIKRQVLIDVGKFETRGEKDTHQQFTDFIFGLRAFQHGFQMFVDTDRIANHYHYDFDDEAMFTKWFNPLDVDSFGNLTPNSLSDR